MILKGKTKIIFFIVAIATVIFMTVAGFLFWRGGDNRFQALRPETKTEQTFLQSPFNDKETYDDIFSGLPKLEVNPEIKAGIVSHHFLAKELIARFYNNIADQNIKTIFLVSPDHFNNFFKPGAIAYTSALSWKTPFGNIYADKNYIDSLTNNENVQISDSIIGLEHGIYIEIPFIKYFFSQAKLVPLVVKNVFKYDDFLALGKKINEISGDRAIMIVSSDFSHNATIEQANKNDKTSIGILNNLTSEKLDNITNDCLACLATLSGFLDKQQNNFNLIDNKNSFDFSGMDQNNVTSYVSGCWAKKDFVQILFLGDLMFDRTIRQAAQKNGNDFIFDKVAGWLAGNDLVVANLEGPLTMNNSTAIYSTPGEETNCIFTFDPSLAKTLFEKNIRLINLGNNHILNFGQRGLESTEKYLQEAGVEYFGVPSGNTQADSVVKEISGVKIGFVGFNQFVGSPVKNASTTLVEIARLKKQNDVVIVYVHWGTEYVVAPSDYIKNLAHSFIDAGADLVIGAHPHVIQTIEEYNGKRIYYSLGNFVFDQYFNQAVRQGLGVVADIDLKTKKINFKEIKFYLQTNGQTVLSK